MRAAHAASRSLPEMCLALGLSPAGKTYRRLRARLAELGLAAPRRPSPPEL